MNVLENWDFLIREHCKIIKAVFVFWSRRKTRISGGVPQQSEKKILQMIIGVSERPSDYPMPPNDRLG